MNLDEAKPLTFPKIDKLSQERRDAFRSDIHVDVKLKADEKEVKAFSRNISKGGILIESPFELVLGKEVFVEFTLPQTNLPMQLKGTVMWVNKVKSIQSTSMTPTAGIKFNWKYLTS